MDNEFHYQLTSDINQHVRVYIGSLEIPAPQKIAQNESSSIQYLRTSNIRLYVTISLHQDGIGSTRSNQVIHQRSELSKNFDHSQMIGQDPNQIGLHAPRSTVHEWGEWLILPVRYSSLSRSAVLKLKVWSLDGNIIGRTLLHVFHESSVMMTGIQKLLVHTSTTNRTVPSKDKGDKEGKEGNHDDCKDDEFIEELTGYIPDELHDVRFRQRRLREQYDNGEMVRVKWLDRAAEAYEQALTYSTNSAHPNRPTIGLPINHICYNHSIFLYIELPRPRHPILYNEKIYDEYYTDGVVGVNGEKNVIRSRNGRSGRNRNRGERTGRRRGVSGNNSSNGNNSNGQHGHSMSMERWYARIEALEEFEPFQAEATSTSSPSSPSSHPLQNNNYGLLWSRSLNTIIDHSFTSSSLSKSNSNTTISPVEHMRETLLKSGLKDEHLLKPTKNIKTEILRIISLFSDELNNEERSTLWKYRHSLIDNSNASVKFILIVDWDKEDEYKIGCDLLSKWTSIGVDSAMKLLTRRFATNYPSVIRKFAVKALESLPDDELQLYMLQLVQALRYDILPTNQDENENGENGGNSGTAAATTTTTTTNDGRYPLVQFLLNRCCNNLSLANDFYWAVEVETEDTNMSNHFTNISKLFQIQLNSTSFGRNILNIISDQVQLVERLKKCHYNSVFRKEIRSLKPPEKSILLKESLGERRPFSDLRSINVLSPLDSSVNLLGILPDKAKFFASATCPMYMEWKLKKNDDLVNAKWSHEYNISESDDTRSVLSNTSTASTVTAISSYPRNPSLTLPKPPNPPDPPNIPNPLLSSRSSTTTTATTDNTTTATTATTTTTTKIRKLSLASIQQQQLDRTIHSKWREDYSKGQLTSALLFKTGTDKEPEDMRQDQLVVQLIDLCDRLWKRECNLDLKLSPYKIVCLSRNCGVMEFIDNATHITDIKNKYSNVRALSVQNYLRCQEGNYDPNEKYNLNPEVLETFIRSSAGYCVITYILAVGDRHLENIMVKKTGECFFPSTSLFVFFFNITFLLFPFTRSFITYRFWFHIWTKSITKKNIINTNEINRRNVTSYGW